MSKQKIFRLFNLLFTGKRQSWDCDSKTKDEKCSPSLGFELQSPGTERQCATNDQCCWVFHVFGKCFTKFVVYIRFFLRTHSFKLSVPCSILKCRKNKCKSQQISKMLIKLWHTFQFLSKVIFNFAHISCQSNVKSVALGDGLDSKKFQRRKSFVGWLLS